MGEGWCLLPRATKPQISHIGAVVDTEDTGVILPYKQKVNTLKLNGKPSDGLYKQENIYIVLYIAKSDTLFLQHLR